MHNKQYVSCCINWPMASSYNYIFTSVQKEFQGNQKDVGMVEANKVSKQGKDCKGTGPVCYKQSVNGCSVIASGIKL